MKQALNFYDKGITIERVMELVAWAAEQEDQKDFYISISSPTLQHEGDYDFSISFKDHADALAMSFKLKYL